MKVIGLTGSIGSGKSTVADYFKAQNIPILDADQMAREVLTPKHVQALFGSQYLTNNQIDRKKLGQLVFKDPQERAKLEALTHPLIAQRLQEALLKLQAEKQAWVIYEAALIFEKNIQDRFDAVILVTVPEALQVSRLLKKGDLSQEEIKLRMQSQMPQEQKIKKADYVIDNSGDLESLEKQVNLLVKHLNNC